MALLDRLTAKEGFERTLERVRVWDGCYITGCVVMPEHVLLLISGTGTVAGENKWVSWSWPEPTLPQKAREGWGNLVSLDSERMGQPLLFSLARGPWRFDLDGSLPARRVVNETAPFPVLWLLH